MPKVVLFIATSLDGYIASPDGTVDWLFHDADYGFTVLMGSVHTVVMGRKTWDQAIEFEDVPFEGKQIVVFSRSKAEAIDARIRFVQGAPSTTTPRFRAALRKISGWLAVGI